MTTTTSSADAPTLDGGRLLRWIVAAVLAGAGLIHVAFAPDHLAESITHGAFFVAVAWIQFALALVVGTGRGGPLTLRIAVAANLAVIAVWGWSRTVGIGGEVRRSVVVRPTLRPWPSRVGSRQRPEWPPGAPPCRGAPSSWCPRR